MNILFEDAIMLSINQFDKQLEFKTSKSMLLLILLQSEYEIIIKNIFAKIM